MEMEISILISVPTWIPLKRLNSPPQSDILRDVKDQEYEFIIPKVPEKKKKEKKNTSNCKASCVSRQRSKYWASAEFLLLLKNIMWDGFYKENLWIWSEYVLYALLVETIPARC